MHLLRGGHSNRDPIQAPSTEWFDARRPPFTSLISELGRCMGGGRTFKPLRAQAACLRFVVDLLNIKTGFLAISRAPADADALSRVALLERMADEASCRCQQQHASALGDTALAALKQAGYAPEPRRHALNESLMDP